MKKIIYINFIKFCILFSLFITGCSTGEKQLNSDFKSLIKETESDLGLIDTSKFKDLAKDHVIKGANFQQMNRYADAILDYQEALKYDSSSAIFSAIAKCYLQLGRYEQAMAYSLKGLSIDSLNVAAMDVLYQIYSYRIKLDDAITVYKQIVELEPGYFRKLTLARLYELQDKEKAIKLYEEMLKDGENQDIMNRLAELYRSKGNFEKYLELTLKLSENKSYNVNLLGNLAEAYFLNKKYQEANGVVDLADSNLIGDDLASFYLKYGDLLYLDTNSESKLYIKDLLQKFDQRFFSRWSVYYLGGFLADKLKDTGKVDLYFSKALEFADTNEDVPIDIGVVYYNNKRYNKALEIFTKFENEFPDNYLYPFYIGTVYIAMDSNVNAVEPLYRALEIEERNVMILGQLGLVYNNLSDFFKSDSIYELALEVNPADALINNNYAYSLSERGIKLDEAKRMTEIALEADSNNSSYLDTYGWIEYKLGDYQKALEYINKSILTGKASNEVWEHLGDIQIKIGNKSEAKKAYEKVLELEKNNEKVRKKLEEIK